MKYIALDRPHLNEGSVFAFPKKVWIIFKLHLTAA